MNVRAYRTEYGGDPGSPRVVLVQGLGGSHLSWMSVGPLLAAAARPVAVDLAGFGLTPGGRQAATVSANSVFLARFLSGEIGEPVILAGTSMGGMIAALTAAARPGLVRGLALVDPVLPRVPGVPSDPEVVRAFRAVMLPVLGLRNMARAAADAAAAANPRWTYHRLDPTTISPCGCSGSTPL
ncbi:MAG: alpha/beta fold hydrolase [Streptosporangiaceae bacterium]